MPYLQVEYFILVMYKEDWTAMYVSTIYKLNIII